ncbi:MAG: dihydroorotate dehydrogenase [Candidatus Eisenbacteria bacterium]
MGMKAQSAGSKPDLSVRLGSVMLRNPVMLASGLAGYGEELSGIIDLRQVGAVVTKTLTLKPCEGNPPPRLAEASSGLINSIGLANMGVHAFASGPLPRLKAIGTNLVVSVGGFSFLEYVRVAGVLEKAGGFAALELNVSCPNVSRGSAHFGSSPSKAARVVRGVRGVTGRPLIVKLTPNVTEISEVAKACVAEGADALTVCNTFRALSIDLNTRRPVLGGTHGGLSGPAIKPLSLAKVWEVASAVDVPIVACGGISSAADALEFIVAGASAFQVGSALLQDFRVPQLILDGLIQYCTDEGIDSLASVRGSLEIRHSAQRHPSTPRGERRKVKARV